MALPAPRPRPWTPGVTLFGASSPVACTVRFISFSLIGEHTRHGCRVCSVKIVRECLCDECDQCDAAARAVAHAGPCAAHAARGWRGPAAGQRKGAAQPPGRLAGGPHAAAWGRMPFQTRKRVGTKGHAGPCAALAARGWRGPAAGQRERSAQPPGRLAGGPHAAAWGAHARHLVLPPHCTAFERVPMQCTAAGCSSCELPSSRSCVTRRTMRRREKCACNARKRRVSFRCTIAHRRRTHLSGPTVVECILMQRVARHHRLQRRWRVHLCVP